MDSNDPLDDFLAAKPERTWRKPKRVVKALREAYTYGVPVLQMKGHIDQMVEHTGYSFVCGTPDETLRRVVAFLLTNCESDTLASLLPLLWARGGREDIVTTGILLVNIDRALSIPMYGARSAGSCGRRSQWRDCCSSSRNCTVLSMALQMMICCSNGSEALRSIPAWPCCASTLAGCGADVLH